MNTHVYDPICDNWGVVVLQILTRFDVVSIEEVLHDTAMQHVLQEANRCDFVFYFKTTVNSVLIFSLNSI
jgi:hypothetical protein